MSQITLDVPREILLDLRINESLFTNYVKSFVAMDLYKNKNVSLGYCAQMAGVPKEDFIRLLGMNNITIFDFDDEEEFLEDADNALRYSKYKPDNSSE